jgi:exopolysaccharide biosynthesis WecB/TagA/CpsF family protein
MTDIRQDIARLPFVNSDDPQRVATSIIQQWKSSGKHLIVHYMYYANYVLMHKDKEFLKDYLTADFILADGIGMQLYFRFVTGIRIANLNGTDMSPVFMDVLADQQIPICLYGTTHENIDACAAKLKERYDRDVVAYYQDGFSALDLEKIPQGAALFIGMGSPRQERWVRDHMDWIMEKQLLVFTVGGFFDFLSGFYIRAPKWVRTIKMEWAWRTMLHPGRHYQKRLRDLSILFRPVIHRMKGYKNYIHTKWL